jgi:hypothetical protein
MANPQKIPWISNLNDCQKCAFLTPFSAPIFPQLLSLPKPPGEGGPTRQLSTELSVLFFHLHLQRTTWKNHFGGGTLGID